MEKSSPGSEFPGLEPQQSKSCWIHPASLAGKHTGGGGKVAIVPAAHCDKEGGELGSKRLTS